MATFQELDAYLSKEFSEDYWADDASLYACELVKQLTTDDWNALKSSWRYRSKHWQERCAEIINWADVRYSVPLLLEMVQVDDDELTLTAADSLRSIGVGELDLSVGENVLERLQAVAQNGKIAKRIINELLKQLNVEAYRNFLIKVLQATYDSKGNPQVVYPLLQENLDKLDDNLAQVLRSWATANLPKLQLERVQGIAAVIVDFGDLIQQFPQGFRASNLEIAITGYGVAATVFTRDAFPQDWARLQNNLGIAYTNRIRGEKAENLETAIRCFQDALELCTRQAFPEQWATFQNNLGEAYRNRIRGEKTENLEAAIRCFQDALELRTRQAFPEYWAAPQNNLGAAYSNRIQGEKAQNLEVAISCFNAALEVFTPQAFPHKWATTQDNLGTAYSNRIQGEKAQNLEVAISCFNAALEVLTREAFPQDWAMTQNNLGVAYLKRIRGERAENLEAANRCFSDALEVLTREPFLKNCAETQFNLGLAYENARQFPKAYTAFAAAIDTVESLRGEIVFGDEVEQKLAEEWNQLYQGMVKVCLELHDYAKAIEYVEHSQSSKLAEFLAKGDFYPESDIAVDKSNELNRHPFANSYYWAEQEIINLSADRCLIGSFPVFRPSG